MHTVFRLVTMAVLFVVLVVPAAPVLALENGTYYQGTSATISSGQDQGTIFDNPLSADSAANDIPGGGNVTTNTDGTVTAANPVTKAQTTIGASTQVKQAYSQNNTNSFIYEVAIGIGGWVAGMAGNVFEITFDTAVLRFGCQFTTQGNCSNLAIGGDGAIGGVVNELWIVIRDLFNITLIFGLIFLGIKTILNADDSSTRRAIGMLLAAALLVNFSLYIAKLVVDISNFTAVQIYTEMFTGNTSGSYSIASGLGSFSLASAGAGNHVASAFMEVLKVASWFNTTVSGSTFSQVIFAIFAMLMVTTSR